MTKLFPRILCSAPVLRGACITAVLACAAGCGQKGSLYLPADAAAAGRATLPEILLPFGGAGSPSIPTPATSTLPVQPAQPATPETTTNEGAGSIPAPVQRP